MPLLSSFSRAPGSHLEADVNPLALVFFPRKKGGGGGGGGGGRKTDRQRRIEQRERERNVQADRQNARQAGRQTRVTERERMNEERKGGGEGGQSWSESSYWRSQET